MSTTAVGDATNEREGASTKASFPMGDLATRCEDTQSAAISLSMLNVGYPSVSGELEGGCVSGRGVNDEEERASLAPETPQRAARPNPGEGEEEREFVRMFGSRRWIYFGQRYVCANKVITYHV